MDNIDKRYQDSKIYIIICEDGNIYIGSTIQSLNNRLCSHKRDETCSMYQYIHNNYDGDWCKCKLELYESYPCNNRKELIKREGEIIRLFGTINKQIAGRTREEYEEFRNNNKEKILEINKKYRNDNKQKIQKYERNRPNKQERAENQKQKIVCECGCISTRNHLLRHQTSNKHQQLIKQQIESILLFLKCF
jgi:predicted GIY-YIG superfamily endonuclease